MYRKTAIPVLVALLALVVALPGATTSCVSGCLRDTDCKHGEQCEAGTGRCIPDSSGQGGSGSTSSSSETSTASSGDGGGGATGSGSGGGNNCVGDVDLDMESDAPHPFNVGAEPVNQVIAHWTVKGGGAFEHFDFTMDRTQEITIAVDAQFTTVQDGGNTTITCQAGPNNDNGLQYLIGCSIPGTANGQWYTLTIDKITGVVPGSAIKTAASGIQAQKACSTSYDELPYVVTNVTKQGSGGATK